MKIIFEGDSNIRKLMGQQQIKKTEYRLMKYLLRTQCEEGILLNNTISGQVVLLSKNEAQYIDNLSALPVDIYRRLIDDYFLVTKDYNERETVNSLRNILSLLHAQKGVNGFLILPTTECNARCAYCFERDVQRVTMNSSIATQVVRYIEAKKGEGIVKLHWFGGEPLVGIYQIDSICNDLREMDIPFESIMTSNGYLFTASTIIKAATKWNLKRVQITLDGTEESYNRIKAYLTPKDNPFKRVIHNIHDLLNQNIRVSLRLNVDEYNHADIVKLLDYLLLEFGEEKGLNIYASMVMKEEYNEPTSDQEENKRILYELVSALNNTINDHGELSSVKKVLSLRYYACMADDSRAVVIYPDGRLGRCQHIRDKDTYGSIYSDILDSEIISKFKEYVNLERCLDCPIYPACLELVACPATANLRSYVCEKTLAREQANLLDCYLNYRNSNKTQE